MKFAPKSDKELSEANLLPAGIYDFEIGTAEDKVSHAGNEMIKVDLTVFDANGGKRFVYDYLMEAMAYKLKHAAQACGLEDKYNNGSLTADDFIGKCGKLKLKIQSDKNGVYADKNVVHDYVVDKDPKATKQEAKNLDDILNDSIPY